MRPDPLSFHFRPEDPTTRTGDELRRAGPDCHFGADCGRAEGAAGPSLFASAVVCEDARAGTNSI